MENQLIITALIKSLETSNKILNSYHQTESNQEKKQIIGDIIGTNTEAIILAMEVQSVPSDSELISVVIAPSGGIIEKLEQLRLEYMDKACKVKDKNIKYEFIDELLTGLLQ